jgi:hypothetical protein
LGWNCDRLNYVAAILTANYIKKKRLCQICIISETNISIYMIANLH